MRPTKFDVLVYLFGPFAFACAYLPLLLLGLLSEFGERAHQPTARRSTRVARPRPPLARPPADDEAGLPPDALH